MHNALCVGVVFILIVIGKCNSNPESGEQTPLEEYVWREIRHDIYSHTLKTTHRKPGVTLYVLRMYSLIWRNDRITNWRKWKHWVTVAVPDVIRHHDAAMVRFEGGERTDQEPTALTYNSPVTERLLKFAIDTGAVAAQVTNIPHQPVTFFDEEESRISDSMLAKSYSLYSSGHYNNTDHYFFSPTIRAARRGVDAVIEFAASVNPDLQITRVMTSGRSKRGMVAWLLAGMDDRVIAVHPEAFTQVNYRPFINDMYEGLGAWPWSFLPLWREQNAAYALFTQRGSFLFEEYVIDPHAYFDKMADKPIMLVLGTGDGYFFPDSTWNFWQDIQSNKYMRLIENNSHRLRGRYDNIWKNMANFFLFTLADDSGPVVSWERSESTGGTQTLTVTADRQPHFVKTWCADTTAQTVVINEDGSETHRRDFREYYITPTFQFVKNPITWTEGPLQDLGNNRYGTQASAPESGGFRACFIEMRFAGPDPGDVNLDEFTLTTEVIVAPNTRPFPPCGSFEECIGTLV